MRNLFLFIFSFSLLANAQSLGEGYLIQLKEGISPYSIVNQSLFEGIEWKEISPQMNVWQAYESREPKAESRNESKFEIRDSRADKSREPKAESRNESKFEIRNSKSWSSSGIYEVDTVSRGAAKKIEGRGSKIEESREPKAKSRNESEGRSSKFEESPLNAPLLLMSQDQALFALRSLPEVMEAQKNHRITYRRNPNDSLYFKQWHFNNDGSQGGIAGSDIDADKAWDVTTGGTTDFGKHEIVVCVVDGGTEIVHEDLQGNLWINEGEIPGNGIDDDENGYLDDVYGWNTYEENSDVTDSTFGLDVDHGTAVAGIIGAKGNNTIGITGINWDIKIMTVVGGGDEANAIASYSYPLYFKEKWLETEGKEGAFVVSINSSWGTDNGMAEDAPLWCAFYNRMGEAGIVNCAATANITLDVDVEGDLPTQCPSEYLISVTNTTKTDIKDSRAGYGLESIDLGAPGTSTFSIRNPNRYEGFGGTSAATPHVTGSVALLMAKPESLLPIYQIRYPERASRYAKEFILNTVDSLSSLEGRTVTGGRLNLGRAIQQNIEDACNAEFNVNVIQTEESISVEWNSEDIPFITTRIQYAEFEDSSEIFYGLTSGEFSVEGLEPCTEYGTLEVWLECPDSTISKYSEPISLRTAACVGTEEILQEVSIYPNPAQDLIQIKMPEGKQVGRILDASGNLVKVGVEQLSNIYQINIESLASGIYFVEIRSEAGVAFTQFIKL